MTQASRGTMELKVERQWTVSNVLSLSRVILMVPIVLLILQPGNQYRLWVIVLMVLSAATDFFDGLLARALNQVTDFGRLLDPIADKICIIAISAALVVVGDAPLWYAGLVALRDILIVAGSVLIINRRKVVVQSVWAGKWTVAFIAAFLLVATLREESLATLKTVLLYLSTAGLFISLGVYVAIYRKHMEENRAA